MNMKYLSKEERLKSMEEEFYRQVNQVISEKITPIYNTFILIFAAFFAYFVMLEQN